MFKSIFICAVLAVATVATAAPARAQVSTGVRGLLSSHFRSSQRVTFQRVAPSGPERAAIERRLGARLPRGEYVVYVATTGTRIDGYAIFDQERGQHELIDFGVFFDARGAVTGVEVVTYREPYGDGIRGERFRRQFVGRDAASSFRSGHEIDVVSGATISTRSMCIGVQRAAVVLETMLSRGREAHASR